MSDATDAMSNADEQLVQQIVEQVLAVLRREGGEQARPNGGAALEGGAPSPRAQVRPPVGVCTGDYSQFPELRQRGVGAQPPAGAGNDTANTGAASPLALTGIVTAQQLQEAMAAASDGVATLAADARLTPLANDLARQHPEKIRRLTRGIANPGHPNHGAAIATADLPWLWWADGHCPAVQQTTQQLGPRVRPTAAPRSEAGLVQVVRDLATGIERRTLQGGLLFVESAALATCYANRLPNLRAVVGTCEDAVQQGIADLGANVLIIEYPHVAPRALDAMVQRMVQQTPNPPAHVDRHLKELSRGG